jgi:hypothetical protein
LERHRRAQGHAGRNHRQLNKEINAGLADPKMKARLTDFGGTPLVGSAADFGKQPLNQVARTIEMRLKQIGSLRLRLGGMLAQACRLVTSALIQSAS